MQKGNKSEKMVKEEKEKKDLTAFSYLNKEKLHIKTTTVRTTFSLNTLRYTVGH